GMGLFVIVVFISSKSPLTSIVCSFSLSVGEATISTSVSVVPIPAKDKIIATLIFLGYFSIAKLADPLKIVLSFDKLYSSKTCAGFSILIFTGLNFKLN